MAKSERIKGNRSPAPPKITIGDGSIRDLAYWLMGGDVSTKRGRKKVSSSEVRAEVTSLARAQMEGNSPYVPDYAAREKAFDETVQRNRSEPDQREFSPRGYSNPYANKVSPPDRRAMYGRAAPQAQPVIDNPFTPVSPDRPRPLMNQYQNPKIQQEGEFGKNSDAYSGDPEFGYDYKIENDIMMTPPGAMAYGGMVTTPKKRKKKKMYGGKMKKYAKGGGIRKPKYS